MAKSACYLVSPKVNNWKKPQIGLLTSGYSHMTSVEEVSNKTKSCFQNGTVIKMEREVEGFKSYWNHVTSMLINPFYHSPFSRNLSCSVLDLPVLSW